MAVTKKAGRRTPWCFDYYEQQPDGTRVRRSEFFATKAEADAAADRWRRGRPAGRPRVDRNITVRDYAALVIARHQGAPRTVECVRLTCENHLVPYFGTLRMRDLSRSDALAFLVEKKSEPVYRRDRLGRIVTDTQGAPVPLRAQRASASVRIMYSVLRYLGHEAVDDGILDANPCAKLGRKLKLEIKPKARQNAVEKRAMTADQVQRFLASARTLTPKFWPLFMLLARTGLRIGEALALRVTDLRADYRALRVERELSDDGRRVTPPKTNKSTRTVDVTAQAAAVMQQLVEVQRAKDKLRQGWRSLPLWLFYAEVEPAPDALLPDGSLNPHGTLDAHNVRRGMRRVLLALHRTDLEAQRPRATCFPTHFTPHSLRHTYASLLIANGKAVTYVQQQLGHEDFSLTVNTYGSWLPHTGTDGSDVLDDQAADA